MTIEAIPTLTEENFSSWSTRITALFKLGGLKEKMITGEPDLEDVDNTILCAIIIAKISPATHENVVNATNETLQDPPGTPQAPQEVVFSRFSSDRAGSFVFFRRIVVGPSEHAQDPRISFGTLGLRSERFLDPPRPLNDSGSSSDAPEPTRLSSDDPERPPTPLDAPQGSRSLANVSQGPHSAPKRPRTPQRGPRTPETPPECEPGSQK
ncbi:hypothetical protein PGTUg99_006448 [Puccinia graminis f. sp. tritici]|uniref:DUF4219 domain-containing protein n=1 Tax=Puccinia graminis f. sp. tritici TaxID=56615 RepID=A0A5B0NXY3_PUCGR|nr:hypothetical protein PGTUg99_006448 [Puccinia graminis f. sp. tritici]